MSTTFIATLIVKPDHEAEFENLQRQLSAATHTEEPGTVVYDVLKSRTQPHTYVVYGRFSSEATFEEHMKSPGHERLVPPILACLATAMDLQMFDWKS